LLSPTSSPAASAGPPAPDPRDALADGPQPASDVEELAEKRGIGINQLERAKQQLGVTASRMDDGRGVCYALPG